MPDLEQACIRALNRIEGKLDEANFLENSTSNQSKCLTWYEHRKRRITASHFYNVSRNTASNSTTYPNSIVASIMQYNPSIDHIPALRWGRQDEDWACKAYTTKIQLEHQGVCVWCCGLVVSPKYPFLSFPRWDLIMHHLFQYCSARDQMSLQVSRSTPNIRYPIKW